MSTTGSSPQGSGQGSWRAEDFVRRIGLWRLPGSMSAPRVAAESFGLVRRIARCKAIGDRRERSFVDTTQFTTQGWWTNGRRDAADASHRREHRPRSSQGSRRSAGHDAVPWSHLTERGLAPGIARGTDARLCRAACWEQVSRSNRINLALGCPVPT